MSVLTLASLQRALDEQKRSGEQLGKVLVGMGAITHADLDEALAKQAELRG